MSTKGRSRSRKASTTPPPPDARTESAPILKMDATPPPPPSSSDTDRVGPRSKARPGRTSSLRSRKSRTPPPPGVASGKLEASVPALHDDEPSAPKVEAATPPPPVAVTAPAVAAPAPSPFSEPAAPASVPSERAVAAADQHPAGLEEHDHFFNSEPPPASRHGDAHVEEEAPDPRVAHKMSAAVQQRRARFAKYVKIAVAVSLVVCVVAVLRFKLVVTPQEASANGVTAVPATPATAKKAAVQPPTPESATKPPQAPGASTEAAKVEPPAPSAAESAAAPAASASASASAVASAASSAPAAASSEPAASASAAPQELDVEGAKKAKREAKNFLEGGAYKKAIEAGERAVAMNPADGDAWYVLGSAYMLNNDHDNQVRCFTRCLAEKGGNQECAQFGGKRPPKQ